MSVRGWVKGASWEPRGSELVAPAAIGDTVLFVEWAGEFDDDTDDASSVSMLLDLNGTQLAYVAVDDDAESITLAAPLTFAASEDDSVLVVSGGQVMLDYIAHVDLGSGDEAEVAIPFGDRDLWPEGDYDEPVQVLLSDDLERIEEVPGRTPVRDNAFSYDPILFAYRAVPTTTWATGEWLGIPGWTVTEQADITYALDGWWQVNTPGLYQAIGSVAFENGGGGVRGVRFVIQRVGDPLVSGTINMVPSNADTETGFTGLQVVQWCRLNPGDQIQLQGRQVSGASLDLLGATDGSRTAISIVRMSA